jgi:two-component system KDP operon response regulator KdpE
VITTLANARTVSPSLSPKHIPGSSPQPQPGALVLAGDESTGQILNAYLARCGFATASIPVGGPVLAEIGRQRPHVIFLSLGEGNDAALHACEEMRRTVSTPIIACSTSRELAPVVEALQAGADDYFVLPMRIPEFLSRVRAIVRRLRRSHVSAPQQDSIIAGDVEVRPQEHRSYRGGQQLDLSPTEFRLLTALVRNAGRTMSHGKLLAQVWGAGYTDSGASLRIYIRRLPPSSAMIRSSPARAASATASSRRLQSPRRPPEPLAYSWQPRQKFVIR